MSETDQSQEEGFLKRFFQKNLSLGAFIILVGIAIIIAISFGYDPKYVRGYNNTQSQIKNSFMGVLSMEIGSYLYEKISSSKVSEWFQKERVEGFLNHSARIIRAILGVPGDKNIVMIDLIMLFLANAVIFYWVCEVLRIERKSLKIIVNLSILLLILTGASYRLGVFLAYIFRFIVFTITNIRTLIVLIVLSILVVIYFPNLIKKVWKKIKKWITGKENNKRIIGGEVVHNYTGENI